MPPSTIRGYNRLTGHLKIVLALLGISVFINYIDRGNLSIAAPVIKDELGITGTQLGFLLGAFFYTYAFLQPITGWLVDRLNVNWVFAGGFFLWSAATATTGLVHTFATLFVLRLMLGIGESVAFPSYSKIIALNYPEEHRGLANAVVSSGLALGPGLGMLMGGMLMARFGWRSFFITLGLVSLLWLVPWVKWMPKAHSPVREDATGAPSLLEFLSLRSAWGTCAGLFCNNYMNYFLMGWLPYYLERERHFSVEKMARTGGIAYLIAAGSATLSGWLSDRWIAAGGTPTRVRKTFVGAGASAAGVFFGLSVLGGSSFCISMLFVGMILFGVMISNTWAITQTLAGPQAAGRWTGFQNFAGNFAGVASATLTGFVLDRTGHFYWAFAVLTGIAFLGTFFWVVVVGPVEQVAWGKGLAVVVVPAGR